MSPHTSIPRFPSARPVHLFSPGMACVIYGDGLSRRWCGTCLRTRTVRFQRHRDGPAPLAVVGDAHISGGSAICRPFLRKEGTSSSNSRTSSHIYCLGAQQAGAVHALQNASGPLRSKPGKPPCKHGQPLCWIVGTSEKRLILV